jgi:arabinofuranosyltransferase
MALVLVVVLPRTVLAAKVIPPGKEPVLRAMIEPHTLGQVVRDGYVLHDIRIDRDRVELSLLGASDDAAATLTLIPRQDLDPRGSPSFSFVFAGDEGARAAADAIADSIRARDRGDVYVSIEEAPRNTSEPEPAANETGAPESHESGAPQTWSPRERAMYLVKVAALALLFVGAVVLGRVAARVRVRGWEESLAGGTMVAALLATAAYAWTCADATISLRYAANLVAGHGLVFNLGERVQGFTNPLWTLGLSLGAVWDSHLIWATNLGLSCSAGALAWLWSCMRRLDPEPSAARFAAVVALTFGCQPFLAFSTSGLENSAMHMLVAASLAASLAERPNAVLLAAALALLNRLDVAPLIGPLVAIAWWRSGATTRERLAACRRGLIVGAALLLGWFGFATIYYGYPLPNTWYAKGGLHLDMGLRYLADFLAKRPSSGIVLLGGPLAALAWSRTPALRAAAIGVLLQIVYVVSVGGDYMHGRFFTAPLLLAAVCLVGIIPPADRVRRAVTALIVVLSVATIFDLARASIGGEDRGDLFMVERDPEFALWRRGPVETTPSVPAPFELDTVVISSHLVGQVFGSDLRIAWIDGYGLTDPYVARCPSFERDPRPGHAKRLIPRAYLRARGDVRQLPDGLDRLDTNDAGLGPEIAAMRADPRWPSDEHRRRHEELELLTRGPIFDPARLRLIPSYVFGRNALPPFDPAEAFDVPTAAEARPYLGSGSTSAMVTQAPSPSSSSSSPNASRLEPTHGPSSQ